MTPPRDPTTVLVGRVAERRALHEALAALGHGRSSCVVLRGEAGIGKSRLLDHVAASAVGATVLRSAGDEDESQMAFAGLHQLLRPLLPGADALPPPQRDALAAVFGLTAPSAPDRFLVALAVLTLVANAAAERPLVLLVDDAQWLDAESTVVLGFVARRLAADPVAVVVATRDVGPEASLTGLPTWTLTGLSEDEVAALLTAHGNDVRDLPDLHHLVAETGGNPLALTELVHALTARHWTPGTPLPDPLPLAERLERHFLEQVRGLPADTRTVLLLAAADPTRDADLLARAARLFGTTLAAADPAVSAGIFAVDPVPGFRHPLIRSAVHRGAEPADRRRAHHVLAEVTDIAADPDRRAWHQAAASLGPDRGVAGRLEQSAERAGRRGGWSMQAAFLERAARLSPDRADRSRRLLSAAHAHLVADQLPAAQQQLDDAEVELRDPRLLVRARRLRAALEIVSVRPARAPVVLLDAIADARDDDPDLAWDMAFEALGAAQLAGEYTQRTSLHAVAAVALDLPPRKHQSRSADTLLTALATRVVHGHAAAVPLLREAVAAVRADVEPGELSVPLAVLGATAAAELWDDVGRRSLLAHLIDHDRTRGAVNALQVSLELSAAGDVWAGDFGAATVKYAESESLARGSVQDVTHRTELLAWQGDTDAVRRATHLMIDQWGPALGIGAMEQFGHLTRTIAENGEGRHADALVSARRLLTVDPLGLSAQALPEVVEAAVRGGDPDLARSALARLEQRAEASGLPWGLALLARCRAMVTDDDETEGLYRDAVQSLATTEIRTEQARTQLLFGEWLRRRTRLVDARVQLRAAHTCFAAMGAEGFARRARRELRAAGDSVGASLASRSDPLTPQETQIAQLAADGATNKEIATQLFLSEGTIEYHLAKVFRKLDLTSRRQLRRHLTS